MMSCHTLAESGMDTRGPIMNVRHGLTKLRCYAVLTILYDFTHLNLLLPLPLTERVHKEECETTHTRQDGAQEEVL